MSEDSKRVKCSIMLSFWRKYIISYNSTRVKKFWHEAQETNQGRRDRFYTEIVIRLSRWSRRLLLQNLHSEHDNLCITPHLMKLLMNWFCYIQFHCGVNNYHNGFSQYCPTLPKSKIPMYLEIFKMSLYTLNEKTKYVHFSYEK